MPDPITPEDLYGPSSTPVPPENQPQPVAEQPVTAATEAVPPTQPQIPVEETPEIPMPSPPSPPKPKMLPGSMLGLCILFIGLFGLGMWISNYLKHSVPAGVTGQTVQGETSAPAADPLAGWKTYQVISGTTNQPIDGISFKLPANVLAPACDTATCISQGTYLPGGTRFTIAPRGVGQLLPDFRGSTISDAGGMEFVSTDTTVRGHIAKLFTGGAGGTTAGGYGFSQVRGYMVEVTTSLSLEISHFSPNGVTADFAADDALFDQIVNSLVLPD